MKLATKDLLRLATIGSVDDGKSTLIGRLLVDTRQLFDDQLDAVAAASEKRGVGDLDLSFVTDGLRAEREQGITIDVAYRYATTPDAQVHHRRLPGSRAVHAQHGDRRLDGRPRAGGARRRARAQGADPPPPRASPRCWACAPSSSRSTRWTPVDWSESAYRRRASTRSTTLARELGFDVGDVIPVSALLGDNVVEPLVAHPLVRRAHGARAPSRRRDAGVVGRTPASGARLPVQWVLRQTGGGRTYAGMVNGATLHVGDDVTLLPANIETTTSRRSRRARGRTTRRPSVSPSTWPSPTRPTPVAAT